MTRMNSDLGRLPLRITLGGCILLHGIAKLQGGVDGIAQGLTAMGLPGFVAYGVYVGEIVAPVLVIVGWYSRIGAALIAVNMMFAIGIAHQRGPVQIRASKAAGRSSCRACISSPRSPSRCLGPGRFSINER